MSFDMEAFGAITAQASALPARRKPPKHRHATPSGPWPFLDLDDEIDTTQFFDPPPQHEAHPASAHGHPRPWSHYPQAQFPNWTKIQQDKSGISRLVNRRASLRTRGMNSGTEHCRVYTLDIHADGVFHADGNRLRSKEPDWAVKTGRVGLEDVEESASAFWKALGDSPERDARVRAFFVDDLNGPVLQMLGTKFHIEPFFFSSSLNSIPSRYQEQVRPKEGDHITITLSFIRTLPNPSTTLPTPATASRASLESLSPSNTFNLNTHAGFMRESTAFNDLDESMIQHKLRSSFMLRAAKAPIIDIDAPLVLTSNPSTMLVLDILSLHVIRKNRKDDEGDPSNAEDNGISTIISYHPSSGPPYQTTTAPTLHKRLLAAGRSVYWSNIFRSTVPKGDPTFVALSLLWYPLYAWDEVLEGLVGEVAFLEAHTLSTLPNTQSTAYLPDSNVNLHPHPDVDAHDQTHVLTHQLHVVRAHLLHYENLLSDFRNSVVFLGENVNPGLSAETMELGSSVPRARAPTHTLTQSPVSGSVYLSSPSSMNMAYASNIDTASPSIYPPSLRAALPSRAGEASTIARAARDTLDSFPIALREKEAEGAASDDSRDAESGRVDLERDLERDRERDRTSSIHESESYSRLLSKECTNLLEEIDRLEMTRAMLNNRLGNVMDLAFSSVNIEDSRRMKNLAEASGRDSAVMKQISYLTMIFLPASFVATVFGMNVVEITGDRSMKGTLPHYLAAALPLTALTVYIMMLQYRREKRRQRRDSITTSKTATPSRVMELVLRILAYLNISPGSRRGRVGRTVARWWSKMWWPFGVLVREFSPWAPTRGARSQSRSRPHSNIIPSPGTSLRTGAVTASQPRSGLNPQADHTGTEEGRARVEGTRRANEEEGVEAEGEGKVPVVLSARDVLSASPTPR